MPERAPVAYLITSYTRPDQVLRLARTLRAGSAEAALVVHHDDRACRLDRAAFEALGVHWVEPTCRVAWGEPSQLEMVLRCLRELLERVRFGWVVLLSGQDYPIRPVAEIERALAAAAVDAFIEALPVPRPRLAGAGRVDEFARRYHYRWRRVPAAVAARLERARPPVHVRALSGRPWLGMPALRSPFGPDLVCHRGSDWFTLSRRAVEAVERFTRARPQVLRHYRRTLIPTESYVQTVLANDPSLRLSGDTRRFTLWDPPPAARPRVLGTADLERILASGADFARKFDESADRAVLDALDRRVIPAPG